MIGRTSVTYNLLHHCGGEFIKVIGKLGCYRRMRRLSLLTRTVVALGALLPVVTRAQGPPARDYLNAPVNTIRFFGDFVATNAETAADSDIPLPNNVMVGRQGFASLLWSFPLGSRYGGIAVSQGYAAVRVDGPAGRVQTTGFTDPGITFHANFFGAPALRLDEIREATPQTYSSIHLTINPPLGSYDRNAAVNTGGNRWAFTPVFNLDITKDGGVSWIDLYAGGRFVTDNRAFQGNNRLSQDPLLVLTAHYSHNIGKKMYASIGVHYDNGGQAFVNGIPQHDYANGFRPGVSVSRAIGKFRVTLRYENTASKPNTAPTNGLLSLRLSGPLFDY
jgi:hypothetical protein